MHAKIIVLLSLRIALADEQPFLDLKKVIRGALDVVAAVPTSTPANYGFGGTPQLPSQGGVQGIDPVIREKLSRLFHIPPDFVHRLAAQTGYIDYEPTTTAKPTLDYWFRPRSQVSYMTPEYSTGSAFIQENPANMFSSANDLSSMVARQNSFPILQQQAVDSRSVPEQQAIVFQPIYKDGHLYYQPFGVMPQAAQPKVILYGGQIYVATPVQSVTQNQETMISVPDSQNSKETSIQKAEEKIQESASEAQERMRNRRIYTEYVKAAEEAQIKAAQLQQATVPDNSPIEIPGIESKPVMTTPLPYRKVYSLKELENYYAMQQFDSSKNAHKINSNTKKQINMASGVFDQQRELIEIPLTTSTEPYYQPTTTTTTTTTTVPNIADSVKYASNGGTFRQLPTNQVNIRLDPKRQTDETETDEVNEEQATSDQQTDTTVNEQSFPEQEEDNKSAELEGKSQQMRRILALRRKMAADRKKFAERKRMLSSMKRKVNKAENTDREIFRRHCYNIRSFARQFGVLDIKQYAISNCAFIENYYPDLKCGEVQVFVDRCLELFRQDEFLIN